MSIAALIIVNTVLCVGVIAVVVGPLVWAILTQQRDTEAVVAQRRRRARAAAAPQPRAQRPQYRPAARPA
jgi:ABC-type glycerol-3-phosphate transport system permease component